MMRKFFLAFFALVMCATGIAVGDYAATQGSGTTFGSAVVGGVHYVRNLLCDPTTVTQCAVVNSSGVISVGLPTGASTSANQATEIASLATIATNTGAAIPAGTALIGKVGIDQTTPGTTNGISISNVNGVTTLAGNGATGTGSQRVTVASDNTPFPIKIDQTTPGTTNLVQNSQDPCSYSAKVNQTISFQTTTLTQQIAASGSNKIYICSMSLIASAATVFSVSGGTGSNCASNQLGILGVAGTATHGLSLAANGGMTFGNGSGTIAVTAASSEICLVQSGSGDLSGNITYVYAP